MGVTPGDRHKVTKWKTAASAIDGCFALVSPEPVAPPASLSLLDPSMPTLCLLDALDSQGWQRRSALSYHGPQNMRKVFDEGAPLKQKFYLLPVLLISTGVE